jgi:hypothetical protein
MKTIVGLCLTALILLCLASVATRADFIDSENSIENAVSAGTLNLQVGDADPLSTNFSLSGLNPGANGCASAWSVFNTGSINGGLCLAFGEITNLENGCNEIEIAAGDTGDAQGELGGLLKIAVWMDTGDIGWSAGDYFLDPSGTDIIGVQYSGGSALPESAYFSVDSFGGKSSESLQVIDGNSTAGDLKVDYLFSETDSHDFVAQSDSCFFDIYFILNQ